MRKNLISVIILAICIVNLVLNALLVFVFLPAMKKTDNLVTEIAAILNLELDKDDSLGSGPDIKDAKAYNVSEPTSINLKKDGQDLDKNGIEDVHWAMIGISISMDGSAKDYDDISAKLAETESWVYDVTRSVVQEYTYDEINSAEVQATVKKQITEGLRERYQTDCIYDVTFSSFMTQ
ncbi:MAG: flagellar basal body-associated FliL family protein [Lachnospiraceae bacterium]|nr:flagellar basal body-associated FliL family protein [Lachnospiraceae bacterium]